MVKWNLIFCRIQVSLLEIYTFAGIGITGDGGFRSLRIFARTDRERRSKTSGPP
jgi:hypothetical protein